MKIILLAGAVFAGALLLVSGVSHAQTKKNPDACPPNIPLSQCIANFQKVVGDTSGFDTSEKGADVGLIIQRVVLTALGLVGTLFFVYMFYGGYLWFSAAGSEDRINKARDIIKNSTIGLAIVIGAFAISAFVLRAILG